MLIVDDHPLMRRGLSELILHEPDLEVCGEAADAVDALRAIETSSPDLVILDLRLKGSNGLDLINEIVARGHRVRMLVSSMLDESIYAERVLRAGAMGYVAKEEPGETLLAAMRRVLAGEVYVSPQMASRLLNQVVGGHGTLDGSPMDRLSDRELEVFVEIGQGQTTRQIADTMSRSVKTVETYRERIKTKLGLKSGTELTRYAVQWVLDNR